MRMYTSSFRYGGFEFEQRDDDDDVLATLWYYNKGWHMMPSYYNVLSNMVLRGSLNDSQRADQDKYGRTCSLTLDDQLSGYEWNIIGLDWIG